MQTKLPRSFYLLSLLLIIIAIADVLPSVSAAKAASHSINAPDIPIEALPTATQDRRQEASPLKDKAQKIMNNAQNWLTGKANMIIGDTKVAVKNEIKRRIDQQIKSIETPATETIETIKKIISAKYNQAIDAIKKIYKKALPGFDK